MASKGIFCNRTLNLRSIRAIGYDMDYTLIHYRIEEWERIAYESVKQGFAALGWPVEDLFFDPDLICRGLIIDTENGNLVKANRFGFIKRAIHGTVPLEFDSLRETYSRTIVDLSKRRWVFLNTLFSLSEGCLYAQLVDLLDRKRLPEGIGYSELYKRVKDMLDQAHMNGKLKEEVMADPERFVVLEPDAAAALLDQKHSGKKLMLITNSEWSYTRAIMKYAFERFLPAGMGWRELFDVVIVSARKPDFFTTENPLFEVVTEEGLLSPAGKGLRSGAAFLGGSVRQVEKYLGLTGDEILYVGDHMFGDVKVTKAVLRWRTALVLRELEEEIEAVEAFRPSEVRLGELMREKQHLEDESCQLRLGLQNHQKPEAALKTRLTEIRARSETLDHEITPLAQASSVLNNPTWGPLMRTGNDKSLLAFQLERYADIYTSRVANFLAATPFAYFRSPRGSLPHDP